MIFPSVIRLLARNPGLDRSSALQTIKQLSLFEVTFSGGQVPCVLAAQWSPVFPLYHNPSNLVLIPEKFGIHFVARVSLFSYVTRPVYTGTYIDLINLVKDARIYSALRQHFFDLLKYTPSGHAAMWIRQYNTKGRQLGLTILEYLMYSLYLYKSIVPMLEKIPVGVLIQPLDLHAYLENNSVKVKMLKSQTGRNNYIRELHFIHDQDGNRIVGKMKLGGDALAPGAQLLLPRITRPGEGEFK